MTQFIEFQALDAGDLVTASVNVSAIAAYQQAVMQHQQAPYDPPRTKITLVNGGTIIALCAYDEFYKKVQRAAEREREIDVISGVDPKLGDLLAAVHSAQDAVDSASTRNAP